MHGYMKVNFTLTLHLLNQCSVPFGVKGRLSTKYFSGNTLLRKLSVPHGPNVIYVKMNIRY